jgi:hypothetical protein
MSSPPKLGVNLPTSSRVAFTSNSQESNAQASPALSVATATATAAGSVLSSSSISVTSGDWGPAAAAAQSGSGSSGGWLLTSSQESNAQASPALSVATATATAASSVLSSSSTSVTSGDWAAVAAIQSGSGSSGGWHSGFSSSTWVALWTNFVKNDDTRSIPPCLQLEVMGKLVGDLLEYMTKVFGQNTSEIGVTLTAFIKQAAMVYTNTNLKTITFSRMYNPIINGDYIGRAIEIHKCTVVVIEVMKTSGELALALQKAAKINEQTLVAIDIIFKARDFQIKLFTDLYEILLGTPNFKLFIKIYKASLNEQKWLFTELEEVVKLKELEKDAETKRELDLRKAQLVEAIQLLAQLIKEERDSLELVYKKQAFVKEWEIEKELAAIQAAIAKEQEAKSRCWLKKFVKEFEIEIEVSKVEQKQAVNQELELATKERIAQGHKVESVLTSCLLCTIPAYMFTSFLRREVKK